MKEHMYINEKYPIDVELPKHLLDYIDELEGYYREDDWISFNCLLEGVEASIKSCELSGLITKKQLEILFRRYGLG